MINSDEGGLIEKINELIQQHIIHIKHDITCYTREKVLIEMTPPGKGCLYLILINYRPDNGERLLKFGHTCNLTNRKRAHQKSNNNGYLIKAYHTVNEKELEKRFKLHDKIKPLIREIPQKYTDGKHKEVIAINNIKLDEIDKIVEELNMEIKNEGNIDPYSNLLNKITDLSDENNNLLNKKNYIVNEYNNLNDKYQKCQVELNTYNEFMKLFPVAKKQYTDLMKKIGFNNLYPSK